MWHRLAIVIYFLLHIPMVAIPFTSEFWESIGINTYKARCLSNNQYVALQGSMDDSPYTFDDRILSEESNLGTLKTVSFYCSNYNQIRPHILAYRQAKTDQEQVQANSAFFAEFGETRQSALKNYQLEIMSTYSDYQPLWDTIAIILGYYLLLQLVRVVYIYIVFGKLVLYPYKNPRQIAIVKD